MTKLDELDQRNAEELKEFRATKAHEKEELETSFLKQLSTLRALYIEVCVVLCFLQCISCCFWCRNWI